MRSNSVRGKYPAESTVRRRGSHQGVDTRRRVRRKGILESACYKSAILPLPYLSDDGSHGASTELRELEVPNAIINSKWSAKLNVLSKYMIIGKLLLSNKGEIVGLIMFMEKVRTNLQPKLMFTENVNDYI